MRMPGDAIIPFSTVVDMVVISDFSISVMEITGLIYV